MAEMYLMSTHASILVDSVGPPSVEICRTAASRSEERRVGKECRL